jgi:tetratricopeptide (TPR) repeat protein
MLYYLLVNNNTMEHSRRILMAGSLFLGLVVSVYFIIQHEHLGMGRIFPGAWVFRLHPNDASLNSIPIVGTTLMPLFARPDRLEVYRNSLYLHTAQQRLGRVAVDAGRCEEGVAHLELAYQAAPSNFATWKSLGLAYMWVGRLDEAEPLLRGIKDIVQELNVWGGWRSRQGEMELAANAYRMSLRLEPGQAAVQKALATLTQE